MAGGRREEDEFVGVDGEFLEVDQLKSYGVRQRRQLIEICI